MYYKFTTVQYKNDFINLQLLSVIFKILRVWIQKTYLIFCNLINCF